ncbi:MAG: Hsp20/alpha crystallin family protein [Pseudomonadales bacterium]|nr:Hsp20/alpha crystallin family protein [Pseudomonadales bacterium]
MNLIPRNSLFDVESFFDEAFPSFRLLPENKVNTGRLAVDITENDDNFVVKADFPGIKKDDIKITLDNNVLTIAAEYKQEAEKKEKGRVIRQERRYGKYSRSFSLGSGVNEKAVAAAFDNGVLSVTIPKDTQHKIKNTQIPIK